MATVVAEIVATPRAVMVHFELSIVPDLIGLFAFFVNRPRRLRYGTL